MNTGELNKYFGAATGALLVFLLAGFLAEELYHPHEPEELAYALEIESAEGPAEPEPEVDFASLLQQASADAGEQVFRKCSACHQLEDGANAVGPHLYDVVGREIDAVAGYDYSGALEEQGDVWSFDNLNHFLENPQGWAPGTKMGFAGLADPEDRAAVIVYLNQVGDSPEPLPEPAAAPVEEAATEATAEGGETADAAPVEQEGVVEVDPTEEGTAEAELAETVGDADGAAGGQTTSEVSQAMSEANAELNESETPGPTAVTTEPETPGATPAPAAVPAAGEAAGGETLEAALQNTSPETGERLFAEACILCHTLDEGAHGVAPSLHGVIGREIAGVPHFSYSEALRDMEGTWSVRRIEEYVAEGSDAPGGHGGYVGGRTTSQRAAIIAYIAQRSGETTPVTPETGAASAGADALSLDQAAEDAGEAVEGAALEASDAAGDAVAAVEAEAVEAAETVEEGASNVVETVEEAASEAAETVEQGAEAVAETIEEGLSAAGAAAVGAEQAVEEEVAEAAEAVEEAVAPEEAAPAGGASPELAAALAGVEASAGERIYRQCQACHQLDGRNTVGPHLGDVVGRPIAGLADYSYSDALQEKASEGAWTFDHLSAWLEDPRAWAPGTKMVYRGLSDIEDRAAVIKYLNEQSADPLPYP